MRQAVVLVGGKGTRLGALTKQTPKPMLQVGGQPFLEYLIWNLSRHGIEQIILSCGYLGEQIADHFKGKKWGQTEVRCIMEPEPLGTGGALRFLAEHLQPHFFLLNGDSMFDINYMDLPILSNVPSDAQAIIALRHVSNASRYGRVETVPKQTSPHDQENGDQENGIDGIPGKQIVRFLEKSPHPSPGLISAGIYWLDRTLVDRLPEGVSSTEQELFPQLAEEGRLFGKPYTGYFIDIGVPDDYHRADRDLRSWKRRPAVFFDRDGVINMNHGYVYTPDRFEWVEGAIQAIRWCNDHGYLVIIVTNQSGIARGYYDASQFHALMAWVQSELGSAGAHIDAVYFCPHHPTEGRAPLKTTCHCRKPNPGMLKQALSDWDIETEHSLLIGDKPWDMEAAQRAGLTGHLFSKGNLNTFLKSHLQQR